MDISDSVERKIEALKKHVSQASPRGDGRDVGDFVKANAKRVGERAEFPYAEGFRRIQMRR